MFQTFADIMAALPPTTGPSVCTMALPLGGRARVMLNSTNLRSVKPTTLKASSPPATPPASTPQHVAEMRAALRQVMREEQSALATAQQGVLAAREARERAEQLRDDALADIAAVKEGLGHDVDVLVGGRVTVATLPEVLRAADGAILGSVLKTTGDDPRVDPARAGRSAMVLEESYLDALAARLDDAGLDHDGPQPVTASRVLVLTDPDGNQVVVTGT